MADPRCPECGGTFTIDQTALIEEAYVERGFAVRGEPLPTRLRLATVGFCDACPFSIEIT
jgi:hypothetical protein